MRTVLATSQRSFYARVLPIKGASGEIERHSKGGSLNWKFHCRSSLLKNNLELLLQDQLGTCESLQFWFKQGRVHLELTEELGTRYIRVWQERRSYVFMGRFPKAWERRQGQSHCKEAQREHCIQLGRWSLKCSGDIRCLRNQNQSASVRKS